LSGRDENSLVVAAFPEDHAAIDAQRILVGAGDERVEDPLLLPGRRIKRKHLQLRRGGVEHAMHHDGVALNLRPAVGARVAAAIGPGHLEP
jgi:hypothetical protein